MSRNKMSASESEVRVKPFTDCVYLSSQCVDLAKDCSGNCTVKDYFPNAPHKTSKMFTPTTHSDFVEVKTDFLLCKDVSVNSDHIDPVLVHFVCSEAKVSLKEPGLEDFQLSTVVFCSLPANHSNTVRNVAVCFSACSV